MHWHCFRDEIQRKMAEENQINRSPKGPMKHRCKPEVWFHPRYPKAVRYIAGLPCPVHTEMLHVPCGLLSSNDVKRGVRNDGKIPFSWSIREKKVQSSFECWSSRTSSCDRMRMNATSKRGLPCAHEGSTWGNFIEILTSSNLLPISVSRRGPGITLFERRSGGADAEVLPVNENIES